MKHFHLPVIALVAMVVSSCATAKYVSKSDLQSIKDVAVFTPFTHITWMDGINGACQSDSLSRIYAQMVTKSIQESALPTGKLVDNEFRDDEVYQSAMASLADISAMKAGETAAPEPLVRLLRDNRQRYGVFVSTDAYMNSNQDFERSVATNAAAGILTTVLSGGTVTSHAIPDRRIFKVCTAVVDSSTGRIVFYNTGTFEGVNLAEEEDVRGIIELLFKDFCK